MSKKLVVFIVSSIALLVFFLLAHFYVVPQFARYMPIAIDIYGIICVVIVCRTKRRKFTKVLKENCWWIRANIIYLVLLGVMPRARVYIGLMLVLVNILGYIAYTYRSRETSC